MRLATAVCLTPPDPAENPKRVLPVRGLFGRFQFDYVYHEVSVVDRLFHEAVRPLLELALKGNDSTVLLYGSAKTDKAANLEGNHGMLKGLLQLSADYMMRSGLQDASYPSRLLEATFCGLTTTQNATLLDLLAPKGYREEKLREGTATKWLQKLEAMPLRRTEDITQVICQGQALRSQWESSSTRPIPLHTMWTLQVTSAEGQLLGKVTFLSLAALEAKDPLIHASSSTDTASRYLATCYSSLTRVLLALGGRGQGLTTSGAQVGGASRVPWRECPLTRWAYERLRSVQHVLVVGTACLAPVCAADALSTLSFVSRLQQAPFEGDKAVTVSVSWEESNEAGGGSAGETWRPKVVMGQKIGSTSWTSAGAETGLSCKTSEVTAPMSSTEVAQNGLAGPLLQPNRVWLSSAMVRNCQNGNQHQGHTMQCSPVHGNRNTGRTSETGTGVVLGDIEGRSECDNGQALETGSSKGRDTPCSSRAQILPQTSACRANEGPKRRQAPDRYSSGCLERCSLSTNIVNYRSPSPAIPTPGTSILNPLDSQAGTVRYFPPCSPTGTVDTAAYDELLALMHHHPDGARCQHLVERLFGHLHKVDKHDPDALPQNRCSSPASVHLQRSSSLGCSSSHRQGSPALAPGEVSPRISAKYSRASSEAKVWNLQAEVKKLRCNCDELVLQLDAQNEELKTLRRERDIVKEEKARLAEQLKNHLDSLSDEVNMLREKSMEAAQNADKERSARMLVEHELIQAQMILETFQTHGDRVLEVHRQLAHTRAALDACRRDRNRLQLMVWSDDRHGSEPRLDVDGRQNRKHEAKGASRPKYLARKAEREKVTGSNPSSPENSPPVCQPLLGPSICSHALQSDDVGQSPVSTVQTIMLPQASTTSSSSPTGQLRVDMLPQSINQLLGQLWDVLVDNPDELFLPSKEDSPAGVETQGNQYPGESTTPALLHLDWGEEEVASTLVQAAKEAKYLVTCQGLLVDKVASIEARYSRLRDHLEEMLHVMDRLKEDNVVLTEEVDRGEVDRQRYLHQLRELEDQLMVAKKVLSQGPEGLCAHLGDMTPCVVADNDRIPHLSSSREWIKQLEKDLDDARTGLSLQRDANKALHELLGKKDEELQKAKVEQESLKRRYEASELKVLALEEEGSQVSESEAHLRSDLVRMREELQRLLRAQATVEELAATAVSQQDKMADRTKQVEGELEECRVELSRSCAHEAELRAEVARLLTVNDKTQVTLTKVTGELSEATAMLAKQQAEASVLKQQLNERLAQQCEEKGPDGYQDITSLKDKTEDQGGAASQLLFARQQIHKMMSERAHLQDEVLHLRTDLLEAKLKLDESRLCARVHEDVPLHLHKTKTAGGVYSQGDRQQLTNESSGKKPDLPQQMTRPVV